MLPNVSYLPFVVQFSVAAEICKIGKFGKLSNQLYAWQFENKKDEIGIVYSNEIRYVDYVAQIGAYVLDLQRRTLNEN